MRFAGLVCTGLLGTLAACLGPLNRGPSDDQTPPTTGHLDIEQWLAEGSYKSWTCEAQVHEMRFPSPHGFNRICSNPVIVAAAAADPTGTAQWPKGSAAVKEIYAKLTATVPVGYAVYLKTDEDSKGGANWYWYERASLTLDFPQDVYGVAADSKGGSGAARGICVACHIAVGSDLQHTPTPGGHDQVYTPVTSPTSTAR